MSTAIAAHHSKPLIIAEIGQNHNGDMAAAEELIRAAKSAGADVAKFQVYDAKALFPPRDVNPWYDYNCSTELTRSNVKRLAAYCAKAGIEFMASVFDVERVDWLEDVEVKRYKVASRSVRDAPLLARLAHTHKPVLVSLGMWDEAEFPRVVGAVSVDYLYCISKYPTPLSDLKLSTVDFKKYSGFSDHSEGITAACAAFVLGARILEKHLTLDKTAYGPDHACSMTPDELSAITRFRNEWVECAS